MTAPLMRLWAALMALVTVYDVLVGAWPFAIAAAAAVAVALTWLHLGRGAADLQAALDEVAAGRRPVQLDEVSEDRR